MNSEFHEEKIAHLGFIQGVINRMGNNSFLIKGWTVTLVAAIFALASKDTNQNFIYISLVPIIVFWLLDSYYLRQERLFRKLYGKVAEGDKSYNFCMNTALVEGEVDSMHRIMTTKSILPFYGLIVVIMFFVIMLMTGWHFWETTGQLCRK